MPLVNIEEVGAPFMGMPNLESFTRDLMVPFCHEPPFLPEPQKQYIVALDAFAYVMWKEREKDRERARTYFTFQKR